MSDSKPSTALASPAAARNREPILAVLQPLLPPAGLVLEIAAGTGEHAVHFAAACPALAWQPADLDPDALASIGAWRAQAGLPNLLAPLRLDAADPVSWPVAKADAVVAINMIHISPWAATEGLIAGAARVLPPGGLLFLYGPYIESDIETAPSNLAFDTSLRSRDPAWGIRRLEKVAALAGRHGIVLDARTAMPAHNLALAFRKA